MDECCNASARKEISVKPKIIATRRARSMNQHYCRMTPSGRWDEQSACKCDIAIAKAHFFLSVRRGRSIAYVPQRERRRDVAATNSAINNSVTERAIEYDRPFTRL